MFQDPYGLSPAVQDDSGNTAQESTVFNKIEDSDIIIEHHGIKVHAHRAILRMCSPFFQRVFQSQWPVAKGPVFSLGDDDDPVIVDAMLRHMYNLPYSQSLNTKETNAYDVYKFYYDVFMLADKYDCPSLRRDAVANFRRAADKVDMDSKLSLMMIIPDLCGPDARRTADSALRQSKQQKHMAKDREGLEDGSNRIGEDKCFSSSLQTKDFAGHEKSKDAR